MSSFGVPNTSKHTETHGGLDLVPKLFIGTFLQGNQKRYFVDTSNVKSDETCIVLMSHETNET